jgi:signal transduction histidine kinase
MSAAWALSSVRPPDFIRTTTFRWTLAVAGAFALYIVVLFGAVYWRTERYLTARSDAVITMQAQTFAAATPERRLGAIEEFLRQDPRMVQYAGLFTAEGQRTAGNLARLPAGLQIGGPAQQSLVPVGPGGAERQGVRSIARRLPDGGVLVVARNVDEVNEIAGIVGEGLAMGLIPALCLCVAAGALLSIRAQRRVEEVNKRAQRIVAGDLRQRLPTRGVDDAFDKLAMIVNGMLEKIEALIHEIAGVGDDIAHDLRTPLTRVRVRLERGRGHATTLDELRAVVDQSIAGLDQSLSIITALLRIAEIEHNRRLEGFSRVRLAPLMREIGDLYEPIAEDKRVALRIEAADEAVVNGDRDLLFEAVANLVDNAVKFTPEDGRVELTLLQREGETVISVKDTGPGIPDIERKAVTKRFYRSDKSRGSEGLGLGLSLVAAIVKLHGFRFTIAPGPGCTAEIACLREPETVGHSADL